MKCKHCHNKIWFSVLMGWRDLLGNICNDGYKHWPDYKDATFKNTHGAVSV